MKETHKLDISPENQETAGLNGKIQFLNSGDPKIQFLNSGDPLCCVC